MNKINVAKNAGFCFGVKRAVDSVFKILGQYPHIYTIGELIHNRHVIDRLCEQGVQVVQTPREIPDLPGTVVVIRSHGLPEKEHEFLAKTGCKVLDLTCPFVKRIHQKVRSTQHSNIVIVGKADHPEVIGIQGWAGVPVYIVNSPQEAADLPPISDVLVVAQTTITQKLWEDVVSVLQSTCKNAEFFHSICDTTQKRQNEAVELAKKSDVVLVIGGKNSSNTEKLYNLCKKICQKTYYIENIHELPLENISSNDIISIIAGASTPDWIIREVKTRMTEVEKQGTQQDIQENIDEVAGVENNITEQNVAEAEAAAPAEEPAAAAAQNEADEDDFAAQLEKTFVYIRKGQLVSGTIIQISDSEICVSIGYKSDGIIKKENLSAQGDENPADLFKVGDTIEAEVVSLNDGEGNVVLSRKSIESKLKWKELVENLDTAKVYTVKVDKVVKGGVITKFEGYEAFIPASQLSLKYVEDLSEFVGQDIEVTILDVDKKQRRFVLSHKTVLQQQEAEKEQALYDSFKKGDKVKGKIKRLTDFGAFVDIGGIDGLLHITDISWVKVKHPSDVLKNGEEIEVLILNVDPEKKRVSLGLKQLTPKPWDLAPEKYVVGSEVEGTVVRILPFGAFVSLEPTIDGLVHISQITNRRLEKVEEELRVGDVVRAKVMGVDAAKKRITLSIRALLPEEKKESRPAVEKDEDGVNFKYEIPPVDSATTTLADFFPKMDDADNE